MSKINCARAIATPMELPSASVLAEPADLATIIPIRAVRAKEAIKILGISRSHLWAIQNSNCCSYDKTFPKRFKLGQGPNSPTVWWMHELIEWLQGHAAASPCRL